MHKPLTLSSVLEYWSGAISLKLFFWFKDESMPIWDSRIEVRSSYSTFVFTRIRSLVLLLAYEILSV